MNADPTRTTPDVPNATPAPAPEAETALQEVARIRETLRHASARSSVAEAEELAELAPVVEHAFLASRAYLEGRDYLGLVRSLFSAYTTYRGRRVTRAAHARART